MVPGPNGQYCFLGSLLQVRYCFFCSFPVYISLPFHIISFSHPHFGEIPLSAQSRDDHARLCASSRLMMFMQEEGQLEEQGSQILVKTRGTHDAQRQGGALSPVAFSGLLHMKHCHAPAASLKPNTSKNLTSSRWSCTWSRSCFRKTKHKEHNDLPATQHSETGKRVVEAGWPMLNLCYGGGQSIEKISPVSPWKRAAPQTLPRECSLMQRQ